MESQNGHRPALSGSSGSTAAATARPSAASFRRAAHGAVLVFVGGLGFFAFVIGSGIFGTIGQVVISVVFFGTALSWIWWVRMDEAQREHVVGAVRAYLRLKPSHP